MAPKKLINFFRQVRVPSEMHLIRKFSAKKKKVGNKQNEKTHFLLRVENENVFDRLMKMNPIKSEFRRFT